jgi:REP element-mobilizing transposase RayT
VLGLSREPAVGATETNFSESGLTGNLPKTAISKSRAKVLSMKQQSLFADEVKNEFGGSLLKKGKRKGARPLNLKAPIHLVLKAEDSIQLFQKSGLIKNQFKKLSLKFGVKVYSLAVHEDHIHGVVKVPSRRLYRAWIRSLSGTLCRQIKGLKWRLRPYTKIITWGKQFRNTLAYIKFNHNQSEFLEKAWSRFKQFESGLYQFVRASQVIKSSN